nr:hypothetical protein [Iodidimonas nitroreducens]
MENLHYGIRQHVHSDSKEAIGRALAEQIPDNSSLFINVGTTTEAAGHALINRCNGLKIITNNLNVAIEASNKADFEVIVTGGRVRGADKAVVGASAVDMIEQFMVDFAIVGISGIDSTGNLLDFDYREVRVAQAILRNARTVYLLADSTKFGRNALVKMGHVSQLTALFTDQHPPKPIADLLDRHGVRVIVSGPTAP